MSELIKGLEGVIAAETKISSIDGINGVLTIRGYNIHDIAANSNFEEMCYLLIFGKLPTKSELKEFNKKLKENRNLPKEVLKLMKGYAPTSAPMDALRSTVSLLSHYDQLVGDNSKEANIEKSISLIAKFPTIVAAHDRLKKGMKPVKPKKKFDHSTNFLYMLWDRTPEEIDAKAIDLDFLLTAEHGLNASTFSARVTAATLSDIYSAITSAIGTLRGPLHGGARSGVYKMLQQIGEPGSAEKFVRDALAKKEKIMGWGHRVYKTTDPRATEFKNFAKKMSEEKREMRWFEMSEEIEEVLLKEPYFVERKLFPNVDFYPSIIYLLLNIPTGLTDSIFAIGRVPGWCAHVLEQWENNRLIRPRGKYVGEQNLKYIPIKKRK